MFEFKIIHLLLFIIAIFLLYHLLGGYGCYNKVIESFSVGGNYKCVRSIPTKKTCTLSECNPGEDNQGTQLCQGCDGWMLNEYLSTDNPFLKTLNKASQ